MAIAENLKKIRLRIERAARKAGRDPAEIKLVAVIKKVPTELILQALEAGITDLGENRVQEARGRYEIIKEKFPHAAWHLIGHLQRNKVRQALDMFAIIHSVDCEDLAEEINKRAAVPIPVLIEVNTSGEASKFGVAEERAVELVRFASSFEKLKVQGLMTMGPLAKDPEMSRPGFKKLKRLSEEIKALNLPGVGMRFLSMGMTDDFEIAIEEGANIVRLGRAIFND